MAARLVGLVEQEEEDGPGRRREQMGDERFHGLFTEGNGVWAGLILKSSIKIIWDWM